MLAILTVNSLADTNINMDGVLTLREAVQVVNQGNTNGLDNVTITSQFSGTLGSNDTIQFAALLNDQEILLNRSLGHIDIVKQLRIDASALQDGITVDANDPTPGIFIGDGIRAFNVTDTSSGMNPPSVEIVHLTITGGDISQFFDPGPEGGAIRSAGLLTLRQVTILNNSADVGGGIYVEVAGGGSTSRDVLTIEDSVIEGNEAFTGGGVVVVAGIFGSQTTDAISITDATFLDNHSFDHGGGLRAEMRGGGELSIIDSTFELNESDGFGGGLHVSMSRDGAVSIEGSSWIENHAEGDGGGAYFLLGDQAAAMLSIAECHFVENSANVGGGLRVDMPGAGHAFGQELIFSMDRSMFESNHALANAGGLFLGIGSGAQATIQDSVITGNDAGIALQGGGAIPNSGGGMYAYLSGGQSDLPAILTIARSEMSGNMAGQHGGGLAVCTKRDDSYSTIPQLSIYNSTISGNQAGHTTPAPYDPGTGGGVHLAIFDGNPEEALETRFANVTLTNNTADLGGGVWSFNQTNPSFADARNDVRLTNSIVSGNKKHNATPSNLFGSFNIAETVFNIIGTDNNPTNPNQLTFDHASHNAAELLTFAQGNNNFTDNPGLGTLAENGGPTRTHKPLSGSPAIDAGSNSRAVVPFTSTPLTTDQRGIAFPRILDVPGVNDPGDVVDIGAYEVGPPRVKDVVVKGSWASGLQYSFATLVPQGEQLRSIPTQNPNVLEIHFDGPVSMPSDGSALILTRTAQNANGSATTSDIEVQPGQPSPWTFTYDAVNHIARWIFGSALADGKYAIHLNAASVIGSGGQALDGDWANDDNGTPDNFADDPARLFTVGNGVAGSDSGEFRFHFALLAGDYSGDGAVTATEDVTGDGDGDGVVGDADDVTLRNSQAAAKKRLPLRAVGGADLLDDETVNSADLIALLNNWGGAGGLPGDLDLDSDVDGADVVAWQQSIGYGAWATKPLVAAAVAGDFAPRVSNVIVSGSQSTHAPFSYATVAGSGQQLARAPVGGADTISIAFSEAVNVSEHSLVVLGLRTGNAPEVAEFSYDALTNVATWRFEGWAPGDQYVLALSDAVADVDGNLLDGEWANPASVATVNSLVSEFPSGDGDPGGLFTFVMTLLPGDADGDGIVNETDYYDYWQVYYGHSGVSWEYADFDGDGYVDEADYDLLFEFFSTNLQDVSLLADLDGDYDVDDDDLDVISQNAGMTGAEREDGDLDGDGVVDEDDFELAMSQYGVSGLFLSVVG